MRFLVLLPVLLAWLSTEVVHGEVAASPTDRSAMAEITSFDSLSEWVETLSKTEYVPPDPLPKTLEQLDYEQYREIQFRHERAVWGKTKTPFWIETFHRGFVQRDRVSLFVIEAGETREIPFSTDDFRYGIPIDDSESLADAGHAGIRVVGCFPESYDVQEILTFVGSSYFRGRSAETVYGASARGLAVDIGLPQNEEFPRFTAFWVPQRKANEKTQTILALLESPSVCGAYQFELKPGTVETSVHVRGTLYFRKLPEKIGIAPLTSMWIWGDGLDGPSLDKRPAVHDSDGLLVRDGNGDWIWRAFARQSYPSVSRIAAKEVTGFGLIQRNCDYDHFADSNAQYHKRPSLWIEPRQSMKSGAIELLELPGAHEGVDNIGAYWVPNEKPTLGTPMELDYDVRIFPGDLPEQRGVARASKFTVTRAKNQIDLKLHFTADASDGPLARIDADSLIVDTTMVRGELISKSAAKTASGDCVIDVVFRAVEEAPVEIGITLMHGGKEISERFTYLCPDKTPTFMYPQVYTRKE
ncbi:Glucans biosynthesis protein G precursor [Rosistilla carotiformis]|uniref:Glucans biosynthesis protein G n=1 Tax=Rosistilla carotiformis TaxID=2528017 RepID=A0A518JZU3_9BACT|nr:glucan biosynthesis protein [Rosistilla carotiformis]QDV71064.1 Glucans biosynthesis protein G precursor [Rosistilla carotiformis]